MVLQCLLSLYIQRGLPYMFVAVPGHLFYSTKKVLSSTLHMRWRLQKCPTTDNPRMGGIGPTAEGTAKTCSCESLQEYGTGFSLRPLFLPSSWIRVDIQGLQTRVEKMHIQESRWGATCTTRALRTSSTKKAVKNGRVTTAVLFIERTALYWSPSATRYTVHEIEFAKTVII